MYNGTQPLAEQIDPPIIERIRQQTLSEFSRRLMRSRLASMRLAQLLGEHKAPTVLSDVKDIIQEMRGAR